jgi:hypothetical protein
MFERVKLIPKAVEPETTLANPCRLREHCKCPGSWPQGRLKRGKIVDGYIESGPQ